MTEIELQSFLGNALYNKYKNMEPDAQIIYLQNLCESGIFEDTKCVYAHIEMLDKEKTIKEHPYAISQWADGKWHTCFPDEQKTDGRRFVKRNTEQELLDAIYDFWKQETDNPTIKNVFNEWNDRRLELKKIAPGTHQRNISTFKRHYSEFGKRRIRNVTPDEISDFLEEQVPAHELTAKAFSNLKSITKGFLKRAKKKKYINFSIEEMFYDLDTSDVSFAKKRKKDEEEIFTESETDIILRYLIENGDLRNFGILLMFLTGLRVGELVALKFSDMKGNVIHVQRTETRFRKGTKDVYEIKDTPKTDAGDRYVVVPNDYGWLLKRLRALNPFGEFIFSENGKRFTTNVIRRRLTRVCGWLDIPVRSPHKIRKTYASIMLENKVDSKTVIKLMGHTDISCTENYYHRNRKNVEQIAEILDNIPDFKVNSN